MGLEILLIVVIAIAGMIVQGRLQKVFDKYSRVREYSQNIQK